MLSPLSPIAYRIPGNGELRENLSGSQEQGEQDEGGDDRAFRSHGDDSHNAIEWLPNEGRSQV